ncbi:rod shape-determining protein RodA [Pseudobacteriovorax antillogorgiicola]|uniref:Cell elongation-specific peptidoglycan biosynthesis regulator RodA n=1 Tax=Pseudobacteriovorax antillogorgiicola TaxID=1513793 RepID=A0A1Y6C3Q4_9BACT|nr:rod shape-determining protein RodA [Pseudobacteriovorax antillogorgiicola]TCS50193.1 cell elongation-specific peptidoglycan biosynthesis regulator RodA [Pseudobacteriovorax antillogorgiicola]SMF32178.1 cell elongation-specific peptidoglycan biosynthesis regulator RodA [Pseudobacteriovorax antillogorgiicola]
MPSNSKVFRLGEDSLKKSSGHQVSFLVLVFLALLSIGLINLYSASGGNHYFWAQLRNMAVTVGAFFICGWLVPIKKVNSYAYWIVGTICLMLLVVLALGRIAGGAQRWISLGPIGFQPSEFAKLGTAIVVARFFATHKSDLPYRIRDLSPILAIVGLIFAMIFLQPDFGTAGICLLIAVSQMAFVRIDLRSIAIVLISSPLVALLGWHLLLRPYQKLRILNLLNPNLDPQNTGYNSIQSLIAVGSGNLFGKGFMQGTQAHLKFLPERHTDFAFSVFAEEHGFWGGAVVFALFGFLTFTALDIAKNTKDTFSGMLAVGVASFIFWEFVINVAMVLGVFPVVGLPLPFFSYGSSLLLTVCVALGLLVSINRTRYGLSKT